MSRTSGSFRTRGYDGAASKKESLKEALTMKQSVRFILILVLCLALSLSGVLVGAPATQAADTGTWTQLPLYGGNIGCLAIDPLTPTTLYASTNGGVYRSTDSGATWTAVNTAPAPLDVSSLAIDPKAPTILYAGTWYDGVFRSKDSGTTWTAVNTGLTNKTVSSLAINPLTPTTLYAVIGSRVFRSVNSGTTWTAVNTGLTAQAVSCLAINPLTPTTLYAGGSSVFRSVDSGDHWTVTNTGLTGIRVTSLAINPKAPTTLYAGTDSGEDPIVGPAIASGGVFRSTNSGATWTAANTGLMAQRVFSLVINPLTPTTMYVGTNGSGVFRSVNSGTTWTAVNTGIPYMETSSLAINPRTPTTLYAGTGVGVYRSVNRGATWTAANTGITKWEVISLAIDPKTPATLYASFTHNGVFRYVGVSPYALTTTASPSAGGSFRRSPDASSYAPGTVVTLTASPVAGYVFTGWSGALSGTKNPATVTMDANKKVTASFAAKVKSVIQLMIGSRTMYVDGEPVVLDAAPIILNSRTLLPIRAVVEATGGTIAWEASTRKVTIVRKEKPWVLWIDRNVATLNGQSVNIDSDPKVVPIIMSGRTLLPLRFVTEALALDVQWNATTQAITITYTP